MRGRSIILDIEDKSLGVILGLACGDALGAPLEGLTANQIKLSNFQGNIEELEDIPSLIKEASDERTLNLLQRKINSLAMPGLYTDDTQQALVLCDCLTVNGDIDSEYIANSYCKLADYHRAGGFGLFRGSGPGFRTAIQNIRSFKPLDQCGVESAGNGAAMRIAPLGVYYHNDPDKLLTAIIEANKVTHRDIRGIAASAMIAYPVAYLVGDGPAIANDLLNEVQDFVQELEKRLVYYYPAIIYNDDTKQQISQSVQFLKSIIGHDYSEAVSLIDKWAQDKSEISSLDHTAAFAPASVLFSLFHFLKKGDELENAVCSAVSHGGDTDTIAAMVGTLCGARHGYKAIPERWLQSIVELEDLKYRAQSLVNVSIDSSQIESLYEKEKRLCQLEDQYRLKYRRLLNRKLGLPSTCF